MRLRGQLSPNERLQAMLAAREWVVGAMRGRRAQRYPNISPEEINLKVSVNGRTSLYHLPALSLR